MEGMAGVSLNLNDHVNLDGDSEGKTDVAGRDPGVLALLLKGLNKEVRAAVDDLGVIDKGRGAINHASHLDNADDVVKVA